MAGRQCFSSMLFSLHMIIFVPFYFSVVDSSFMPLWSGKTLKIIYLLLNLLRLVLCPSMWCILENVPCTLEKNVYSVCSSVLFFWM